MKLFSILCLGFLFASVTPSFVRMNKRDTCVARCNALWSKKFHDCNGVKECQRYCIDEAQKCVETCETEK